MKLNVKRMNQKFFAALLACALCALGAFIPARAWADVRIDAANFPDENFRRWVKENAAGGKDVLTDAQGAAVEEIELNLCEISSLKGIEHFTALKSLICFDNELTELDVSHNPALETLRCGGNKLATLDLSHNPELVRLSCNSNKLTELDLSRNPALVDLDCGFNELTELDLSHNPALVALDCNTNKLMELDVSHNLALEFLGCDDNELTELDLSKNPALKTLGCESNELTELDLSNNKKLSEASLAETAAVTLPNGDEIAMKDFTLAKGKDGKLRLDLSKYAGKIGKVSVISEWEEVKVKSVKGVHTFAPFFGQLIIPYKLGRDAKLSLTLFVKGDPEKGYE